MLQRVRRSIWLFATMYWCVLGGVAVYTALASPQELAVRIYILALPWSAASYGSTSPTAGWACLAVGIVLNSALALYVGGALVNRRQSEPTHS